MLSLGVVIGISHYGLRTIDDEKGHLYTGLEWFVSFPFRLYGRQVFKRCGQRDYPPLQH